MIPFCCLKETLGAKVLVKDKTPKLLFADLLMGCSVLVVSLPVFSNNPCLNSQGLVAGEKGVWEEIRVSTCVCLV